MPSVKKALIELHYLGSVQYFSKFLSYPTIILEQFENYGKGSYRNRCHIAGANGLLRLTIPLKKGKHQQLPIRQVEISYSENWQKRHWQSIQSAYGNAPFFEYYEAELHSFFQRSYGFLFDFNIALLNKIMDLLELDTSLELSSIYEKESSQAVDLRNSIFPKNQRHKEDAQFEAIPYPQIFADKYGFIANLSILDLLFCTGPQAVLYLENCIVKNQPS